MVSQFAIHPGGVEEEQRSAHREHDLDADDARKWRDHPAQFWLERAITSGLAARGGSAAKVGKAWRVKWADGSESAQACFDARWRMRTRSWNGSRWKTRAPGCDQQLPRFVAGQPLPVIRVTGLPDSVRASGRCGRSAWRLKVLAEKRFLPVFINEEDGPSCRPPSASGICCSLEPWTCMP